MALSEDRTILRGRPGWAAHPARRHAILLQAAINGSRAPTDHPALPVHPEQLAAAAEACIGAGAGAVHFHVRASDGQESLAAADVAAAVRAVRTACRETPIGVSTGAWIEPDPERRVALVRAWQVVPEFASVNFHEPGAVALAEVLLDMGVGVEAGLATPEAAEVLRQAELESRCLRVLLEPAEDAVTAALETVAAIERVLGAGERRTRRLLHGGDATAWPILAEAWRRGYDARIGFEDTLWLPDGSPAADNAALVIAAGRYGAGRPDERNAWISG